MAKCFVSYLDESGGRTFEPCRVHHEFLQSAFRFTYFRCLGCRAGTRPSIAAAGINRTSKRLFRGAWIHVMRDEPGENTFLWYHEARRHHPYIPERKLEANHIDREDS